MNEQQKTALKLLVHEMEYVLSCINEDKVPFDGDDFHEALRLGKEALAQPEQEPVAWWVTGPDGEIDWSDEPIQYKEQRPLEELVDGCGYAPLYTTPPQEQRRCDMRKPLTTEQIWEIAKNLEDASWRQIVDAIESAHGIKEKNT